MLEISPLSCLLVVSCSLSSRAVVLERGSRLGSYHEGKGSCGRCDGPTWSGFALLINLIWDPWTKVDPVTHPIARNAMRLAETCLVVEAPALDDLLDNCIVVKKTSRHA